MAKLIKYKEFIINVDNITYIDVESDGYGHIEVKFGEGRYLNLSKTDELVKLLNSLLEEKDIN